MNNSSLYDETTFYFAFLRDLEGSREQVYIESPFITTERVGQFSPGILTSVARLISQPGRKAIKVL